jgi:hypothetical protein
MAERPETHPKQGMTLPVSDTFHAPFVFFEGAPTFGFVNGVVNVTLAAGRTWISPDSVVVNDYVVVAYLRGNIPAMLSLRQAIDQALLLASPVEGGGASN